ncbi:hypothetical protein [Rhodohalobacter mucosus]|uniref:Uncharacterized protein n=1 Tax=Rhodohalobacter mucosus TaxID=2079485 RepID=A0A316TR01_9BACT|nr:hypothetical protein [Rhodohalobacter mucosus]PWN05455.1 hypothetical protein DDZ15_15435 [Rhodohalobacter mucosus]
MGNLTLNDEQLSRLNSSYAQAGVKWLAMFGGLWAEVLEMKNGLLVLSITWPKHAVQTGYRHEKIGLLLRILFRCRASSDYDLLNGLRRVYILSSIDNSGGGKYSTAQPTNVQ